MSTLARYHPRGIDIDLADLPNDLYREIVSLHGQIDPPPAPPVLTCLGNGQPMYVYRHQSGRYFARHYAGGSRDRHHGGHRITTMSDEHRRQAEYTRRAGADAGLAAVLEKSTGNGTRLDVAVSGQLDIGFEVQRSQLSRARAKIRAVLSFEAGWPTAWVTDAERAPDWADHVPTARLTVRGWDVMPPANTVEAIIGRFHRERDRTSRSGWEYKREPTAVFLDEVVTLMAAGEIIPVAVGTKGQVSLAHKGAAEIIDSCTYPGASVWTPNTATPRQQEIVQDFTRGCAAHPADLDDVEALRNATPEPAELPAEFKRSPIWSDPLPPAWSYPTPTRTYNFPPVVWIKCQRCGRPACHPDSVTSGLCRGCDLKINKALTRNTIAARRA